MNRENVRNRDVKYRRLFWTLCLGATATLGCSIRLARAPEAPTSPPLAAYVVLVESPNHEAVPFGRIVVNGGQSCPDLVGGGRTLATTRRQNPQGFTVDVCEAELPFEQAFAVRGSAITLPAARRKVGRVVVIGDTGCKPNDQAGCGLDDPAWPFPAIARAAAAGKPDLVLHVGDYNYRGTPSSFTPPGGKKTYYYDAGDGTSVGEQCEMPGPYFSQNSTGNPDADAWGAWWLDFFQPAAPLLAAAPWVMARGNHELCSHAGPGWLYFLGPSSDLPAGGGRQVSCPSQDGNGPALPHLVFVEPQVIALDGVTVAVLDSANACDEFSGFTDRYRAQFQSLAARLDGRAGRQAAWLIGHRPIWGVEGTADAPPYQCNNQPGTGPAQPYDVINRTLQCALASPLGSQLLPKLDLLLAGHMHRYESLTFAAGSGRPPQLIVGNSGVLEDSGPPTDSFSQLVDGVATTGLSVERFGYVTLTRNDQGTWRAQLVGVSGEPAVTPAQGTPGAVGAIGTTCAPSFCVGTAADMWAFDPTKVPLSQRASGVWNPSLQPGWKAPRLVGATDEAGNVVKPGMNDYTNGFQGAGDSGNIYNFSQWPYLGLIYYYNHAAMAVPPTGWINAAHRHGVPILGVMTGDCNGCAAADNAFYADATKAATRLALIANTYGFDGWLIDVENGVDLGKATAVMAALRGMKGPGGAPLIALYYEAFVDDLSGSDAQKAFDAAGYFQSDYGPGDPSATYAFVVKNPAPNNNPFTTSYSRYVYANAQDAPCTSSSSQISNGSACLSTQSLFADLASIRKPGGGYYQSPSLYAIGWERWGGPNLNASATRSQVQQAHRDLFVGYGARQLGPTCKPNVSVPNSVAAFVDPFGVALATPFVTRFNTGEGDTFAVQGTVVATTPWNGIGLQDVQPTWLCAQDSSQSVAITYSISYDGGSALSISGAGVASLYATKMTPPPSPIAIVRYQGTKLPQAMVRDGSGSWKRATPTSTSVANGWTTSIQTFPTLSGTITEIGVQALGGTIALGELGIMSSADFQPSKPPATQSLPAPTSGDLTWTSPSGTWYSNVYGCPAPGAPPQLLGRTFQPAFDPRYTLKPAPSSFPSYTVQPVNQAGIAGTVACR